MIRIWHYLRSLWRSQSRAHVQVVLYSHGHCPLCEKAKSFLLDEQKRWGFQLQETDIESDEGLRQRYRDWVPVVTVDGQERFRGAIQPVLWRRLMAAAGKPGKC